MFPLIEIYLLTEKSGISKIRSRPVSFFFIKEDLRKALKFLHYKVCQAAQKEINCVFQFVKRITID